MSCNLDDSVKSERVDVGYVDDAEPWKLESRFFPSKVGGRPAWLNLSELPSLKDMKCGKCNEVCIFLCQVYAPIETREDCFHRTIFLFMCCNPTCHSSYDSSPFIVYRSQLRRDNVFYPFEPPEDSVDWHPECKAEKWCDLCAACGSKGTSHCGRCKSVKYCCRSHQVVHWKDSHKQSCVAENLSNSVIDKSSLLLPEFELIVEPESQDNPKSDKSDISEDEEEEDAESKLEEFEELFKDGKAGTFAGDDSVNVDLLKMAASQEDKVFSAFKNRLSQNPGQVLRYQRGGTPLWISDDHVPSHADIPPCSICGSERIYEFQILPQLLNHLELDNVEDSIDWGILVVYTCKKSCSEGSAYKREFLWKQDIAA